MPDIHHILFVKSHPEKVFDAFSSINGLDSWWTLKSNGHPMLGNTYTFYFDPEHDWRGEVIHCLANKELTWNRTQTRDDWRNTQVGFTLTERDGGTSVSFFHKGWKEANEHFGITSFCWAMLLNGLKNYVEHGIVVPHALRN